jgi:hypothetical protein
MCTGGSARRALRPDLRSRSQSAAMPAAKITHGAKVSTSPSVTVFISLPLPKAQPVLAQLPLLDQPPVHQAAVSARCGADGGEMEMTAGRTGVTVAG